MRLSSMSLMAVFLASIAFSVLAGCSANRAKSSSQESLAQTYANMGGTYLQRGQHDEAREKLLRSLELDPKLPAAHHYLGELYHQLGQNQDAEKHFQKALSLAPGDPEIRNNFGVFLCDLNKLSEAEQQFALAIGNQNYRTPELAYENAGRCAFRNGDVEKAETYFRNALKMNPNMPNSLFQMAMLNFERGNFLGARAYIQRCMDAAPASPQVLWLAVRIERELRDKTAASKYAKQLKNDFPDAKETNLLIRSQGPDN